MNDDTYEKARDPLKRYIARCPLYMPPGNFYKARKGAAIAYWNAYAAAFVAMRAEK